jgi:hypothetical protein
MILSPGLNGRAIFFSLRKAKAEVWSASFSFSYSLSFSARFTADGADQRGLING